MRIYTDMQIHSMFSMATSKKMTLESISVAAKKKGVALLGTGDFTHPKWFSNLKSKLREYNQGIYQFNSIFFILSGEISLVYKKAQKVRKVHLLLYAPDFETVSLLNHELSKYTDLERNGRPIVNGLSCAELVELTENISKEIVIIPAHAWTPWYSVFGSKSGFDSLKECFEDKESSIFAIETGLSSDPPMNWRISSLDRLALVSNSDAHSESKIGREANCFDLKNLTFKEIFSAIRHKEKDKFLYTVEVDPSFGKYHLSGHRKCGYYAYPKEAISKNNKCPICGKSLTVGVLQRVEELADRPEGYRPPNSIDYIRTLPLEDLLRALSQDGLVRAKEIAVLYKRLVSSLGGELQVLVEAPYEEISKFNLHVADAIIDIREGSLEVKPGYDGLFGRPVFRRS